MEALAANEKKIKTRAQQYKKLTILLLNGVSLDCLKTCQTGKKRRENRKTGNKTEKRNPEKIRSLTLTQRSPSFSS